MIFTLRTIRFVSITDSVGIIYSLQTVTFSKKLATSQVWLVNHEKDEQ